AAPFCLAGPAGNDLSSRAPEDIVHIVHFAQYGEDAMKISVSEIRDRLADALNRVAYAGERVVLERRGKGVAALVSLDDLKVLEELEERADIRAASKARKEKGGITLAEYRKKRGI